MFDEVMDIEWSPHCSTLFSSVGKDGKIINFDSNRSIRTLGFNKE
jgi:hypothetical protein